MQQEYMLFFSNFCSYSKEVIGIITRKNIRKAFIFICVDSLQNIPPFVDRVPMIVQKANKQVYADEDIAKVLDEITNLLYAPASISAMPASFIGDQPFHNSDFESLDGSMTQDGSSSYTMLDMEAFRINCIAEDDAIKVKKADSSMLEQYISQRDADIKIIADRPTLR